MRLLTGDDAWRGLGGFGHLAQYTADQTMLVASNEPAVMNCFGCFKFFVGRIWIEEAEGYVNSLDEAERSKCRDRCAPKRNAHNHSS